VPTLFFCLGLAGGEPGQGEHGQGDVGVPGPPGADLVLVEPRLALRLLDAFLDMPAAARGPGQVGGTGPAGPVAGVIGDLLRVGQGAAGQQPVPAAALLPGPHRDPRPVVFARAVGTGSGRDLLPGPRRESQLRAASRSSNACPWRLAADRIVAQQDPHHDPDGDHYPASSPSGLQPGRRDQAGQLAYSESMTAAYLAWMTRRLSFSVGVSSSLSAVHSPGSNSQRLTC
jgi:hypothetical protein